MFRRENVVAALLHDRTGGQPLDTAFETFFRGVACQVDGNFRVTPLLRESVGALHLRDADGHAPFDTLLRTLATDIFAESYPEFGASGLIEALEQNDKPRALAAAAAVADDDLDEIVAFDEWETWTRDRWRAVARITFLQAVVQSQRAVPFGSVGSGGGDALARQLAGAVGASQADVSGVQSLVAGIAASGALHAFAAKLCAQAVVALVEAEPIAANAEAIARRALLIATSVARTRTAGASAGVPPELGVRERLVPLVCAGAPEDSTIDMIFGLTLFEFVERADLPFKTVALAAEALFELPLAPALDAADQFHRALGVVATTLKELGVALPKDAGGVLEERAYAALASALEDVLGAASAPERWAADTENWTAEHWRAVGLAHFAAAVRGGAALLAKPPAGRALGSVDFAETSVRLGAALACGARASADPRGAFVFVVRQLRSLARLDVAA